MTSAPSQASASVHEVPASNWVRSRTFTSSNAVFCDMIYPPAPPTVVAAVSGRCVLTAASARYFRTIRAEKRRPLPCAPLRRRQPEPLPRQQLPGAVLLLPNLERANLCVRRLAVELGLR